ncbi:MAG: hypothetical protein ACTSP9_03175 [Promethearchaeota archaeon]
MADIEEILTKINVCEVNIKRFDEMIKKEKEDRENRVNRLAPIISKIFESFTSSGWLATMNDQLKRGGLNKHNGFEANIPSDEYIRICRKSEKSGSDLDLKYHHGVRDEPRLYFEWNMRAIYSLNKAKFEEFMEDLKEFLVFYVKQMALILLVTIQQECNTKKNKVEWIS